MSSCGDPSYLEPKPYNLIKNGGKKGAHINYTVLMIKKTHFIFEMERCIKL